MSNFLKQGKRIATRKAKKETKHHTKEFYKILAELDRVSAEMLEDKVEVTEENLVEEVGKYTKLEIGKLEQLVLKGKLGMYESMEQDISKAKNESKQEN